MAELRGLGAVRDELQKRGGELIAVSTEKLETQKEARRQLPNLPALFASDPEQKVVKQLHMLHETQGKSVFTPSNVLTDKDGVVRWTYYSGTVVDRVDPAVPLQQIQALK